MKSIAILWHVFGLVCRLVMGAVISGGIIIEGAISRGGSIAGGMLDVIMSSKTLDSPALGTAAMAHAAVTDTGAPIIVTTAITQPTTARNVTATAGGTGANITAVAVIVTGTNDEDAVITETLPVFTAATPGTVTGSKAFKSITSITVPANGAGVTTSIGYGAKLGLGVRLSRDSISRAYLNGVREATLPTVAFSPTVLESNTVQLASALNGTPVVVDFAVE